jgi:8-hydroxy-5-deazaflavin:NADPH oxidoreductase
LKSVIDEIAGSLTGQVVVVPSNPLSTDAQGKVFRLLPEGQSAGDVVAGWLPPSAHLAMAFGSMSADIFESASNRTARSFWHRLSSSRGLRVSDS